MKTKLKVIIPASIAIILIAVLVIFNIPYNLGKSLRFDEIERIVMSVSMSGNIDGQPAFTIGDFSFEKGSDEFTDINKLFAEYSYYLTVGKSVDRADNVKIITILVDDDMNRGLYLINSTGSNIIVNGKIYRMKQNKIEELIDKIANICGLQ